MSLVLPMAADQERIRELGAYFDWAAQSEERAQLSTVADEDEQIAQAVRATDKIVTTKGDHACNRCGRPIPSGSRVWSVSVQRGRGRGGCWWTCEECRPTGEEKRAMTAKTVALLRVSTEEQSIDAQKLQISSWAHAQGLTVDYRVEDGVSGAATERPVLDAAVAELQEGDCLVVAALDRLGRSTLRVVGLLDELHRRGVRVVSLRESLDMATPFGKFAAVILAAVAELERGMIVARTKRGMVAAAARGSVIGRPGAFFAPEVYAEVLAARAKGWTWERIAGAFTACRRRWVADPPLEDGTPSDSGRWEIVNSIALDAKGARLAFRRTVPG